MTRLQQAGLTGCAALLLATMLAAPATARIGCRGNFQMTKYGPIATPFCEEEQIAFVARSYGQRVTAAGGSQQSPDQGLSVSDHWL
jgi:hypothetical protein